MQMETTQGFTSHTLYQLEFRMRTPGTLWETEDGPEGTGILQDLRVLRLKGTLCSHGPYVLSLYTVQGGVCPQRQLTVGSFTTGKRRHPSPDTGTMLTLLGSRKKHTAQFSSEWSKCHSWVSLGKKAKLISSGKDSQRVGERLIAKGKDKVLLWLKRSLSWLRWQHT